MLLADSTTYDDSPVVADRFVAGASDLVGATVTALADLPPGPVGVLGSQALAFGWHARLCAETGREFVAADDLGPRLRWTKSAAEQARLRAAGAIGSAAVDAIVAAAVPGATEAEAVAEGVRVIVAGGGAVYGMGVSSGPSAHTYGPSSPAPYDGRRRLVAGDMFRIDLYGSVDGYCFDFGRSRVVGARATPAQQAVLVAARDSVLAGVSAVRVGATLGDVARACDEAIAASEWAAEAIACRRDWLRGAMPSASGSSRRGSSRPPPTGSSPACVSRSSAASSTPASAARRTRRTCS